MSDYKANPTQEERILELLEERGPEGAFVWDFMMPRNRGGLGIAQYNARVWGLRQKGYVIENVKPGHFVTETGDVIAPTMYSEKRSVIIFVSCNI